MSKEPQQQTSPASSASFWDSPLWKEVNDCRFALRDAKGEKRQSLLLRLESLKAQLNALPGEAGQQRKETNPAVGPEAPQHEEVGELSHMGDASTRKPEETPKARKLKTMKTHQGKIDGGPKSHRQKNKQNTKESARWFIIAPPPFTNGKWQLATTLEGASYKSIVANNKYTVVLTAGSRHAVLFAAAAHSVREIDVFGTEGVSKARTCCNSSCKELLVITDPELDMKTFLQSLADSAQRVGKKLNMGNPSKKPVAKLMAGIKTVAKATAGSKSVPRQNTLG